MGRLKRKPTRRDLLIIIGRLQQKVGHAMARNNDRNQNRQAQVDGALTEAHRLCIQALGQDPPIDRPTGPWADDSPERKYL